jgi:hypothetical protein
MTVRGYYQINGRYVSDPDVMALMDAYRKLSELFDPIRAQVWEECTREWLTRGDLNWLKDNGTDPLSMNPYRRPE